MKAKQKWSCRLQNGAGATANRCQPVPLGPNNAKWQIVPLAIVISRAAPCKQRERMIPRKARAMTKEAAQMDAAPRSSRARGARVEREQ